MAINKEFKDKLTRFCSGLKEKNLVRDCQIKQCDQFSSVVVDFFPFKNEASMSSLHLLCSANEGDCILTGDVPIPTRDKQSQEDFRREIEEFRHGKILEIHDHKDTQHYHPILKGNFGVMSNYLKTIIMRSDMIGDEAVERINKWREGQKHG